MQPYVDRGWISAAWGVVTVVLGGGAVAGWVAAYSPASRFPAWPAWLLSTLTLSAMYACFAYALGTWSVVGGLRGAPIVIIDTPSPGQHVAQTVTASGSAKRVAPDQTLWLIVEASGAFYPQAAVHPSDGARRWGIPVHFGRVGGDVGHMFTLHAVGAPAAASSVFELYLQQEDAGQRPAALRNADGTFPDVKRHASVNVIRGQ